MLLRRSCAAVLGTAAVVLALGARAAVAAPPPDVLVVGGTPAGVAAAVSAARRGRTVELVASGTRLGGVLSDAGMDQWDLNVDAAGTPVEGGLFDDIHAALGDAFTPAAAAAEFGRLADAQPNITLLTDAQPIAVTDVRDGAAATVERVTFRLSSGRTRTVGAPVVIDATDDGDVAALAGARYDVGRQDTGIDARMQAVTLLFTVRGVDWNALENAYDVARDGAGGTAGRRAWGYATMLRRYRSSDPAVLVRDLNFGREADGDVTVNALDVVGIDGRRAADLERARIECMREAPRLVAWLRGRLAGFRAARVSGYADALYVRETRHIAGIATLTTRDVWDSAIPRDAIGLASYPIDLHPLSAADRPAFAPLRHVYGVPFGALVPRGFANLLVVGPAISASHLASGSARIVPTTIEEGEAAGLAAAIAGSVHESFPAFDADGRALHVLTADLVADGAVLVPPGRRMLASR